MVCSVRWWLWQLLHNSRTVPSALWKVQCIFLKKTGQKKTTQDLILESRSEKKKVYLWVWDHFAMTRKIHRSQERPLRLQEDFLETHRRFGTSQAARALKIDTDLPGCILGTSIRSKNTKTPLRNHKRPHRLHGWHLDDALENPGVGPLSRWGKWVKMGKMGKNV